jgi:hypothetical protein
MRAKPASPYEIKAGWDIPAILEQALNWTLSAAQETKLNGLKARIGQRVIFQCQSVRTM